MQVSAPIREAKAAMPDGYEENVTNQLQEDERLAAKLRAAAKAEAEKIRQQKEEAAAEAKKKNGN